MMRTEEWKSFESLMHEAYQKCFRIPMTSVPSETECRRLSAEIEEASGLVIGWKSLKNYFTAIVEQKTGSVNPSIASLDTLARYVSEAPPVTEAQRKLTAGHFPFWYAFLDTHRSSKQQEQLSVKKKLSLSTYLMLGSVVLLACVAWILYDGRSTLKSFQETFDDVSDAALDDHGWQIVSKHADTWNKRNVKSGALTLFTLTGDNWPSAGNPPHISNLLLQQTDHACFSTEVHFSDWIPAENWHQAGLLILEDTLLQGKGIRFAIAYNEFFGGYEKPGEIILQGIATEGATDANPEEFIHHLIFSTGDSSENTLIRQNLKYSALRIEKEGNAFRFLFSMGSGENHSFKEIGKHSLDMQPAFAGIYALKGFQDSSAVVAVHITDFLLQESGCKK